MIRIWRHSIYLSRYDLPMVVLAELQQRRGCRRRSVSSSYQHLLCSSRLRRRRLRRVCCRLQRKVRHGKSWSRSHSRTEHFERHNDAFKSVLLRLFKTTAYDNITAVDCCWVAYIQNPNVDVDISLLYHNNLHWQLCSHMSSVGDVGSSAIMLLYSKDATRQEVY